MFAVLFDLLLALLRFEGFPYLCERKPRRILVDSAGFFFYKLDEFFESISTDSWLSLQHL